MTATTLDFYFDILSPYAYMAYQIVLNYEHQMNVQVTYRPVAMAALFKQSKNLAPGFIDNKFHYLKNKIPAYCRYWNIESLSIPTWFREKMAKASSMEALRVITYIQLYHLEEFHTTVNAFYSRLFKDSRTNFVSSDIDELLTDLGFSLGLKELSKSDEIKEALRSNIRTAFDNNGFGVPYMVLNRPGEETQTFFGVDSLPILFNELGIFRVEFPVQYAKL
ncbi:unnamed protein product [Bursaphelenchus okinawaensis]|uniref:Glutathione S-transferase kappa n=1 Tax=Bursaphelenchus okinawaensis TaxID=465554 RepID=A0A811L1G7_9BILA|nr:unnamed protein product [Bursaphelenchus okinawaensis]CAG9114783.1 unnamed protein product [Bursaphelenchus okinawaensis]